MATHIVNTGTAYQARIGPSSKKYESKHFAFNVYDGKEAAYKAAQEWLVNHPKYHEYSKKRNYRNQELFDVQSNNTTGINGVNRVTKHHTFTSTDYWVAYLIRPDGSLTSRNFSVSKYGEQEAKNMAIQCRKEWENAVDAGKEAVKMFFRKYS